MSTRILACLFVLPLWSATACKKPVADFCEQSSDCNDLGKPFCDVTGEYEESDFIARTCIPFPDDPTKDFCLTSPECPAGTPVCGTDRICRGCTASAECGASAPYCDLDSGTCLACEPDAFQRCDGNNLVVCNATGTSEDVTSCSTTCDANEMRCDDCEPEDFLGCTDGTTASICSSAGVPTATPCAYACNATDMRCEQCEPSTETCNAATEQHIVCDAVGQVSLDETCTLGCSPGTQPVCADVDPSNGLAMYLDMTATAASLTLPNGSTINTSTGVVIDGNSASRITVPNFFVGNGNDIRVFVVKDLTITGTVTVTGSSALAIVADGDITIGGRLIVAATGSTPGPGAVTDPAQGCVGRDYDASQGGDPVRGGAGGGSFGTPGGRGGDLENISLGLTLMGGAAGAWSQATVDQSHALEPLIGGCSGGSAVPDGGGNMGGGGGGAVQLVSRTRIHFNTGAEINAGGGAGAGSLSNGGGGGGSGGAILLEAPEVSTNGTTALLTIGGGGGCGAEDDPAGGPQPAMDGKDANDPTTYQANGGTCTTDGINTRGGHGNPFIADGEVQGMDITGNNPRGTGGGGGGNGIIRINESVVNGVVPFSAIVGVISEGEIRRR